MAYQKTTGPLMANSHPGRYSGQDAYSDMLVVNSSGGYSRNTGRELLQGQRIKKRKRTGVHSADEMQLGWGRNSPDTDGEKRRRGAKDA